MSDLATDRQLKSFAAADVATDTAIGTVLLSYTVPLGKTAVLLFSAYEEKGGTTPDILLAFLRGGTKVQIDALISPQDQVHRVAMESGDIARFEVLEIGAASDTGSFLLSVEERGSNR